jgi:hypothetical protein
MEALSKGCPSTSPAHVRSVRPKPGSATTAADVAFTRRPSWPSIPKAMHSTRHSLKTVTPLTACDRNDATRGACTIFSEASASGSRIGLTRHTTCEARIAIQRAPPRPSPTIDYGSFVATHGTARWTIRVCPGAAEYRRMIGTVLLDFAACSTDVLSGG